MNTNEVTQQILSAWEEEEAPAETPPEDESVVTTPDLEEPEEEEEAGETEEPAEEEEEETEDAEDEEPEDEEPEEPETPVFESEDPEVQAFLAKFQGNVERALKGGAGMQHALSRQGQEKAALARQVQDLQAELERVVRLGHHTNYLQPEQQEWVENAVASGDPIGFVRAAVDAGEYDVARAVCEAWSQESPYEAARLANEVDRVEQRQAQLATEQATEQYQVDHGALMNVLLEHYPEMTAYEERMISTLSALGEHHPLAQDARSNDPETAARGIIGIYEIARASSATVRQTRERVRAGQRQAADTTRRNGVVSTGQATPSAGETPRSPRLGPGLTLQQLDEAWENA